LKDTGAEALGAGPVSTQLRILDLSDDLIGDAGVLALASSPALANLVNLKLS
jgi:hypothetical protein